MSRHVNYLYRCLSYIEDMELNNMDRWEDFAFGPNGTFLLYNFILFNYFIKFWIIQIILSFIIHLLKLKVNDPYGQESLYFDSNSKPPGCFDAESLMWKSYDLINPNIKSVIFDE